MQFSVQLDHAGIEFGDALAQVGLGNGNGLSALFAGRLMRLNSSLWFPTIATRRYKKLSEPVGDMSFIGVDCV
jgi:hypothetical protein